MWSKRVKATAKKFPGVKIETRVIDNDSLEAVTNVEPGGAYGHSVEIGKLRALWPLTLRISSTLNDTRQLAFREGGTSGQDARSWEWEPTLYPDRIAGEEKRLLLCTVPKRRNQDNIMVRIDGDGRGEDLPLKVPIE